MTTTRNGKNLLHFWLMFQQFIFITKLHPHTHKLTMQKSASLERIEEKMWIVCKCEGGKCKMKKSQQESLSMKNKNITQTGIDFFFYSCFLNPVTSQNIHSSWDMQMRWHITTVSLNFHLIWHIRDERKWNFCHFFASKQKFHDIQNDVILDSKNKNHFYFSFFLKVKETEKKLTYWLAIKTFR